jgi:SAM-dependent methyltransferase
MTVEEIRATFRRIPLEDYPELQGLSRADVYRNKMGPGGLFLAARMARALELRRGLNVLDLGCGRGASSIFLAQRYGVSIVAADLWVDPADLEQERRARDLPIEPLRMDAREDLPFPPNRFDHVFCMDAVHYFGGTREFFDRLARCLRPGGLMCIGSPCFEHEPPAGAVPSIYAELWEPEFSRYHSPAWWVT